ncbi:MAG: hypothetical protein L3K13_08560 [Thermoplasmata archaeon]|nr:hypothetical protein [Thermoplasmata archaeon]
MGEYVSVHDLEREEETHPGSISIPYVIGAALMMGLGLFLIASWVLTFNWIYFPGVALAALGFLMILHPLAGSDH